MKMFHVFFEYLHVLVISKAKVQKSLAALQSPAYHAGALPTKQGLEANVHMYVYTCTCTCW